MRKTGARDKTGIGEEGLATYTGRGILEIKSAKAFNLSMSRLIATDGRGLSFIVPMAQGEELAEKSSCIRGASI